jgi:hypothetical protein
LNTPLKTALLVFLTFLFLSLFAGYSLAEPFSELEQVVGQDDQWWLPEYLNEASGIAVMADQSILLHDDEFAVIYHLSLVDRSIEPFGWLGSPEFERDFEGIALNGETLYLVTSDGLIYEATVDLNARSQTFDFSVFDTGLESICELEGLHFLSGKLLLPCKVPIEELYKNKLVVFAFDIETHEIREHLVLPGESFGTLEGPHPTAIEVSGDHYYIVSTNYLFKIGRETSSIDIFSLPKSRHFQPEGIGLLQDGSIVVVDDFRKGDGRLTHYPGIEFLEKTR